MYKLKNSYIDKMVSNKISSKEIDFILYVARFQDETGRIESVYYKDVCSAIDVSIQKFYDIVKSLQKKELITFEKINPADICVKLVNNDFSDKKYSKGYLKVASMKFCDAKFRDMKAGSKLLYLYMQRFIQGKHMLVKNFYDEFCETFQVVQKSLQVYLHELKKNAFLFVSKKRNKAMNYEMTMKLSTVLLEDSFKVPTERDLYLKNIEDLIKYNFKECIPDESKGDVVHDIAQLAATQRAEKYRNYVSLIVAAVSESIHRQKTEGKKRPVLNVAHVNLCLSDVLEQHIMKRYGIEL